MGFTPANPPELVRWKYTDRFGGWRKMKWGMVHLVAQQRLDEPSKTVCGKVINEQGKAEERYAPSATRDSLGCRACKKAVGYDSPT